MPVGWRKTDLARAVKRSSVPPAAGLRLAHCFGYTTDLAGPNLALAFHGAEHRVHEDQRIRVVYRGVAGPDPPLHRPELRRKPAVLRAYGG